MKASASRKKADIESVKSDFRWRISLVFNFFTVFVFGMALFVLALTCETLGVFKTAQWVIQVYIALGWLTTIIGLLGMLTFAFQAFRYYHERQRENR